MRAKITVVIMAALLMALPVTAQLVKGNPAPPIRATDINGQVVDLDEVIGADPYLVILFFFSTDTGEDIALKLRYLDMRYGRDKLRVVALGMKEDAAALKSFAQRLGIKYFIIDSSGLENAAWLEQVFTLPLTLFVQANEERTIERVLVGGGSMEAQVLREVAENLYQQRKAEAAEILDIAIEQGEDEKAATELKGYVLAADGKLDEAEKEFGKIESNTGLAQVALARGELGKAAELADKAGDDPYAQTIKGKALLKEGKVDEAAAVLDKAAQQDARGWQKSETLNAQGRVAQQQGKTDTAIASYQGAVALDPYNVVALSNEGATHREKGDLEKAEQVLQKAASIRPDDMTSVMLQQIQQELKEANNIKRNELIRNQIADLSARFKEMQESGTGAAVDAWSTRPLIMAFLPSANQAPVVFERAGTDVVLQREVESRLQKDGRVSIVERQMLDQLLTELDLGSSDLASADTQRRLGQILSAGMLGFIDFAQTGGGVSMYLRLVDTETTSLAFQTSVPVNENKPSAVVDELMAQILTEVADARELRGLIADAASDDAVIINLGGKHGVKAGQEFTVFVDGDPIEVGGRVIAHRQKAIGMLTVTQVEEEYAICKVSKKREGATLAKEMKVKAAQ